MPEAAAREDVEADYLYDLAAVHFKQIGGVTSTSLDCLAILNEREFES